MLVPAILALLAGAVLAACGGSSKPSTSTTTTAVHRTLPGGLVGVMFDGPVFANGVNLDQQLDAAVASAKVPLPPSGEGQLIIKSVSPKQRPRRPAR